MKESSETKNILVYRIGHLGDTIVAIPAFWEIKKRFPTAKLTLLTNSDERNKNYAMAKNILPRTGLFDSFITYDNSAKGIRKIEVFIRLFFKLKSEKYNCLYYLSTRNRTDRQIDRDLKFFNLAGIKNIVGIDYLKKNQLNFQESKPLPVVESEYQFLIKSIDEKIVKNSTEFNHSLCLTIEEKKRALDWLKTNCGTYLERKKIIAVAPGSKWDSKKWSEEKFIDVLDEFIKGYDVFPVIFGGREDFEAGKRIIDSLRKGANAAGFFSIRESAAALENCLFYLGNDTGTMHLASAVGTPCIGIFAATDYQGRWYPFGDNNRIFRKIVECEGCHSPTCFNKHKCLDLITADEVYAACQELLSEKK